MTDKDDERLERIEAQIDAGSTLFQDVYGQLDGVSQRLDELASGQTETNARLDRLTEQTHHRLDLLTDVTKDLAAPRSIGGIETARSQRGV